MKLEEGKYYKSKNYNHYVKILEITTYHNGSIADVVFAGPCVFIADTNTTCLRKVFSMQEFEMFYQEIEEKKTLSDEILCCADGFNRLPLDKTQEALKKFSI